jgi:hypothetical protein
MSRTTRCFFSIILILIILAMALPFVSGLVFKNCYQEILNNAAADFKLQLSIDEYHVGWLSSDVVITVQPDIQTIQSLQNSPLATLDPKFTIKQHIIHGPVIFDDSKTLLKFGWALVQSQIAMQNVTLATTETLSAFDGSFVSKLKVKPVSKVLPGGDINWGGLETYSTQFMEDKHLNKIKINLTIKPLQLNIPVQRTDLATSDLVFNLTSEKNLPFKLWISKYDIYFKNLSINAPNSRFDLTNLKVNTDSSIGASGMVALSLSAKIDAIKTQSLQIAPLTYLLTITDINAPELNKHMTSPASFRDPYALISALTPTTQLQMNFDMGTNQGKVSLEALFHWVGQQPLTNVRDVLQRENATINLRIAAGLVNYYLNTLPKNPQVAQLGAITPAVPTPAPYDQAVQMLEQLIKQGYIVKEGNDYIIHVKYEESKITVNNILTPFNLDDLLNKIQH